MQIIFCLPRFYAVASDGVLCSELVILLTHGQIASRLWHRPFGLLIDATCYNGQNDEPQDELFHKLELLTPTELSKQLSRVYIYNMNSAFR